jgi:hypothetical protein
MITMPLDKQVERMEDMSKKIIIPVALVLILAMLGGTFGLVTYANAAQPAAQSDPATPVINGGFGQVTGLSQNQFTVKNKNNEKTITVNDQTKYYAWNGESRFFSDLLLNEWVIVRVSKQADGSLLALQVVLLPQSFDGSALNQRSAGIITAVNPSANGFSLKNRNGQELTFTTNASTVFLGKISNLSDLKAGMAVSEGGIRQSDGSLLAMVIAARQPLARHIGKITAVNPAAFTFTMKTAKGEDITYQVDANTVFRSPQGEVKSLSDLKSGMAAIVASKAGSNGYQLATNVLAGDLLDLRLGRWNAGTVTSVSPGSFSIQNLLGAAMTFQVNDATRFLSAGNKVKSLSDLTDGAIVLIHYQRQVNGDLLAKQVLAKVP